MERGKSNKKIQGKMIEKQIESGLEELWASGREIKGEFQPGDTEGESRRKNSAKQEDVWRSAGTIYRGSILQLI